jgi:hypothetical protein
VLADIQHGVNVDPHSPAVLELIDLGLVTTKGMSRRSVLTASAMGAGAGVALLALPQTAAASSSTLLNGNFYVADFGQGLGDNYPPGRYLVAGVPPLSGPAIDLPDDLGFVAPPSMSVEGLPDFPVIDFDTRFGLDAPVPGNDYDRISWLIEILPNTTLSDRYGVEGDNPPTTSPNIRGTFLWAGTTYVVELEYVYLPMLSLPLSPG